MKANILAAACLLCLALLAAPAHALTTSDRALRLEDRREGNVILGAEAAKLEQGEVYHTILLLWGRLDIYGEVDEVVVLSGRVVFHEGAKLTKSLVVMGGSFESLPGAQVVAENVSVREPGPFWRILRSAGVIWRENFDWVARLLSSLSLCLVLWLFGWALFGAFPGLRRNLVDNLLSLWGRNLSAGLFGAFAVPVVGVALVISLVGIALLPLYFLLLFAAGLVSYLTAALWAGHRLLPPAPGQPVRPLGLLLGVVALQFFWVVPVWWALLPVLFLWTLGWGSLLRSLRQIWK